MTLDPVNDWTIVVSLDRLTDPGIARSILVDALIAAGYRPRTTTALTSAYLATMHDVSERAKPESAKPAAEHSRQLRRGR